MDFQKYADGFYSTTGIISVERKEDGGCGDIRIVAGNQKFIAMASDPDNVCFSFGYCFNDSDIDIRDAMRIADEEMYKDKAKYYSEHPERKYR